MLALEHQHDSLDNLEDADDIGDIGGLLDG